ncbi:26S protease regulatory subunit 6B [Giardia muris]|uniref:26S protease regulatory subunit 6B n=1 Tax=Giardia muris TaxID=5742 RepID=A0A4Z1SYT1_GIAMU|nr:26S protease regulatory subunit 6B [Giardia muris]|eukprot:TNJ28658.1 26S protease regulatory subunit 6B [Giardia muris]
MDSFHALQQAEQELQFLQSQISFVHNDFQHLQALHDALVAQLQQNCVTPLVVGQFVELADDDHAVVQPSTSLGNSLVRISSSVDRLKLKPMATLALARNSLAIMKVLPSDNEMRSNVVTVESRPTVTYADVGGYDNAKLELREAIEFPLKNPELFASLNIQPPNAVLLHGPPGCAKSLLVKACANSCDCTFISVTSSACVSKYLGEGARIIRDTFRLARECAPSIIFFDEVDAIANRRSDNASEGDREMARLLMELLTNLDGFDNDAGLKDGKVVKTIFATNKPESLDPALLRTGRADRKILMDYPSKRDKRLIFQVCSKDMTLASDVDFEVFVAKNDKVSGADIAAICTEAGMVAIRSGRYIVCMDDFEQAYVTIVGRRVTDASAFQ